MTRPSGAVVLSVIALGLAIVLGVSFGTESISLARAFSGPGFDRTIVIVRLPRVFLGTIAGAGLSIVGVTLQALLRNPLAEPYVLGVSGGAAVGATVAILLGISGATMLGASVVPLFALGGGVVATALVHIVAEAAPESRGASVLLAGVVVNALAAAVITVVKTIVAPSTLQELLFWLTGYLDGPSSHAPIVAMAFYVAAGSAILLRDAARFNVLSLGDTAAEHLGVSVRGVERRTYLASALVVGAIVSVTGLIGFVGLLVPHALRRVFGPDARLLLPASLGFGGAALVLCDLVSRATFHLLHRQLPVGAVTALIGGTLFLVLLWRRRGHV